MLFLKKNSGFTLIEIVMVIVLIGIVSMVVTACWPSKAIDVDQYAERLAADLRYAKHSAQTKNQRLRVNFSAGSYSLTLVDGSTAVSFANSTSNTVTLPAGLTITIPPTNLPSSYVVFDAMGRPYTNNASPGTLLAATATITMTHSGIVDTVTIEPNTGKIE